MGFLGETLDKCIILAATIDWYISLEGLHHSQLESVAVVLESRIMGLTC